jgi:uncharacterized protein (DUF4213/DUF364 family)
MVIMQAVKDTDNRKVRVHDVELADGYTEIVIETDGIDRDGVALSIDEAVEVARKLLAHIEASYPGKVIF